MRIKTMTIELYSYVCDAIKPDAIPTFQRQLPVFLSVLPQLPPLSPLEPLSPSLSLLPPSLPPIFQCLNPKLQA